jgi:hypothetical protein
LAVSDGEAYYALMSSNIGLQAGTPALATFAHAIFKEAATQHEQFRALTQACGNLRILQVSSDNFQPQAPVRSLDWSAMPNLRSVVLNGPAVAKYLDDFLRAGLTDTLLMVCPRTFTPSGLGSAKDLIIRWVSAGVPATINLESFDFADADVDFAIPFLALIPVRPRCLYLRFQSYNRFEELADSLIEGPGPLLEVTEEIIFSYVTISSAATGRPPNFTEQVGKLEAAGPTGLRVTWEC